MLTILWHAAIYEAGIPALLGSMVGDRSTKNKARWASAERLRHLAWAGLIAAFLQVTTLIAPLDEVMRTWQVYFASFKASGDIVFVGTGYDLAESSVPSRRDDLASVIQKLDRAGAREIYVDVVFERASTPASDENLNASLQAARGRALLIENYVTGVDGLVTLEGSHPAVAHDVPRVGGNIWSNFLGYVWNMSYTVPDGSESLITAPTRMAGVEPIDGAFYPISFFFDITSIPNYRFEKLVADEVDLTLFAGKTVVIGAIDPTHTTKPNIPGIPSVPPSLIHIYAAETLKAGHTSQLDGLIVLVGLLALLGTFALLERRRWRIMANTLACSAVPVTMVIAAQMAVRVDTACALVALTIFGGCRARANWRRNFQLVDAETNLPTFAALEADRDIATHVPALIVARIHRFEEVRRTLPKELHAEYVLRIIARLKAATQDATIYLGKGSMIAWVMSEKDEGLIREHLEGLRALFSSPLLVGENQVDVGITFGVDITPSPNVTRRLAAAVSASEKTSETFEPIAIADSASEEDLIWNISLQARIDTALANGEIYLVYQPKVSVRNGELLGVEALVRWNDPVRGHIPPDQFIRQCENVGRMAQLTRHVLREACMAGNAFADRGMEIAMAVNISATLLHERQIVRKVAGVLAETGFPAERLVLEITETYRINNLSLAAEILAELKALGTKVSMDDFGVGAASLEALVRLPFDELKIDRLFVSQMGSDAKAAGIVRSVLALGQETRITVVAEGVEDAQTLALLRDSGCQVAQGFGISRPVSFNEVLKFQQFAQGLRLINIV